jgi:hypothetical protein
MCLGCAIVVHMSVVQVTFPKKKNLNKIPTLNMFLLAHTVTHHDRARAIDLVMGRPTLSVGKNFNLLGC